MKILYLTNVFPSHENHAHGSFIYHRVKVLEEKGIKVEVIRYNPLFSKQFKFNKKSHYNLNEISFSEDIPVKYINYLKIPGSNLFFKKYMISRLMSIFNNGGFSLIHAHFVWYAELAYWLKQAFKIPYVVTAHGSDIDPYDKVLTVSEKQNTVNILDYAEKAIFVSNFLLDKAKEYGYSGRNSIVINNGIDLDRFSVFNKLNLRIKDNASQKVVGFVGNLLPTKRASLLPEIFYKVSQQYKNVKFIIIGDGELRKRIEDKLKYLSLAERTVITGNIHPELIPEYMNNMDVMVLPSIKEGWGCVAVEAQACGVSVVGSAGTGIAEALEDAGVLIDNDADDIPQKYADAVINLFSNPVPKEKLRERVSRLDWNWTVGKEIEVYKGIIDKQL